MVVVNTNECTRKIIGVFLHLFTSLVWRYIEEFIHWKRRYLDNSRCEGGEENCSCPKCVDYRKVLKESKDSAYNIAWLHYLETIAESAPQLCLQVYIMLVHRDLHWFTVISVFFSFISLPFSITALEKARVTKNDHDFKLYPHTVMFFTCQTFALLSRLSTIVTLAYAWHLWSFLILFLHWCSLNYICLKGLNIMIPWWCFILLSVFAPLYPLTFPFLFHPTEAYHHWLSKEPKAILQDETTSCFPLPYWALFAMISVENIVLTPIALSFPRSDAKYMNVILPISLTFVVFGAIAHEYHFISSVLS